MDAADLGHRTRTRSGCIPLSAGRHGADPRTFEHADRAVLPGGAGCLTYTGS
ncbi:hypothetical protein [Kitasatospora sp. NPDC057015]|uniref:hypothetical protein n=1 Tax=Kitasatospora sp. NPDC057015 TaxID=3346001 RepID=UPI0036306630